MLKLVSIMSVDTIFLTSSNTNEKMKMQRQKFTMNEGDHLTLLNVYKSFIANKKTKVSPIVILNNELSRLLCVDMVSDEQDEPAQFAACLRHTEAIETHFDRTAAESEIMWDEVQSRSVGMNECARLRISLVSFQTSTGSRFIHECCRVLQGERVPNGRVHREGSAGS